MRFLFIPVACALPAIQAHFERWPQDGPPSPHELRELLDLVRRFVPVSEALLTFAKVLRATPARDLRN